MALNLGCLGIGKKVQPSLESKAESSGIPVIDIKPRTWSNIALDSVNLLASRGLYKKDLLYRTFDSGRLAHVLKHGTDRDKTSDMWEARSEEVSAEDVIWADTEEDKLVGGSWLKSDKKGVCTIVVYDKRQLTYVDTHRNCAYRRNGSKPVAVLRVDFNAFAHSYDDVRESEEAARAYRSFKEVHRAEIGEQNEQ